MREEEGEPTEAPIEIENGVGTKPTIVQNDDSKEAEVVDQKQIKEDGNDYAEDLGGAHDDEYAPVKDNHGAQEEADKAAGLEENNGGMSDEEINKRYEELKELQRKREEERAKNTEGGQTTEGNNENNKAEQTASKSGEDKEMSADEKYKEVVAMENVEEARNMSDEETEDILSDLGL